MPGTCEWGLNLLLSGPMISAAFGPVKRIGACSGPGLKVSARTSRSGAKKSGDRLQ
jgi:hypothetical protein